MVWERESERVGEGCCCCCCCCYLRGLGGELERLGEAGLHGVGLKGGGVLLLSFVTPHRRKRRPLTFLTKGSLPSLLLLLRLKLKFLSPLGVG